MPQQGRLRRQQQLRLRSRRLPLDVRRRLLDPLSGPSRSGVRVRVGGAGPRQAIAAVPGLMERLRVALEADLAGPDVFIGDNPRPFGQVVEKSFGERLLTFLQDDGPSSEWVSASTEA